MSEFHQVAGVNELESGQRRAIVVDEISMLLIRIGDEFFAIEDYCSHDGRPLNNGPIEDCSITCPRHGAKFDLRTGRPLCMPATEPIYTFEVQVRDGNVFVKVPE